MAPMLLKPRKRDDTQKGGSCCCSFPSRQLAFLASLKTLKFPLFLLIANAIRGSPAAAWNACFRLVSSLPSMKRAPFSRASLGLAGGAFFPPRSYRRSVQSAVPIFFSEILFAYSAVRSCGRLIAPVLGVLFLVEIWARWRLLGLLCHTWRPGVAKRGFSRRF